MMKGQNSPYTQEQKYGTGLGLGTQMGNVSPKRIKERGSFFNRHPIWGVVMVVAVITVILFLIFVTMSFA